MFFILLFLLFAFTFALARKSNPAAFSCGVSEALRQSVINGIPERELMTLDTSLRDEAPNRRKRQAAAAPLRIKPDYTYFHSGFH